MNEEDPEVISDFYVYVHKDSRTGIPFYVGKGRGNRAYDCKLRAAGWREVVDELHGDYDVEIVNNNLLERDAYELEADLIFKLGKKCDGNGPLINRTDGGKNELGNIGICIKVPALQEAYDKTTCIILKGTERKEFAHTLAQALKLKLAEIANIYEDNIEDEVYEDIEIIIGSLEDEVKEFSRQRISCKDICFALGETIEDLEYILESEEIDKKQTLLFIKEAIEELTLMRNKISYKKE